MEEQLMPDTKTISSTNSPPIPGETVLKLLPAAIYMCDREGRLTFFNEEATKLWGYAPALNDDSVKYCPCIRMQLPDGAEVTRSESPMALALTRGISIRNTEALVQCANGKNFYISINVDPVFDDTGNITGGICFFQDVSQHKQTERALSESEQRYRNLIHKLDIPLYTTDRDGVITLCNQAAITLWGRHPEVGIEKWSGAFRMFYIDGTELAREDCPLAVSMREGKPIRDTEVLVMRPDGSVLHVAAHPQPLFDENGNVSGAVNMLLDLTNIKRTEVALRESEHKYRRLAASLERKVKEKSQDLLRKNLELKESEERYHKMVEDVEDYAILLLDQDGIIQNWNKGAEKIKGYSENEIIGHSFETFYLDEDIKRHVPQMLLGEARTHGKAISEGWRKKKDGSLFWANVLITALRNENGDLIGFTKVTRDFTEKKISEDKLREYSNRLEFQNRELEQFAYAASHDLKEPLRKIHLYHSFIADSPANQLDEKSKEYLLRSAKALKRMNTLIEDLLSYSRATANIDDFTDVDLNTITDEIIIEHAEEIEQHIATIKRAHLPTIKGVSFQCKQLFENLIENSIKYRDPSRMCTVSIDAAVVEASGVAALRNKGNKQFHRVSIIDNGLGFDSKYAEKIFEVFQRLNIRKETSGSGIGLAICRKIALHHGGMITATGVAGEGARFDVYFPIAR